MRLCRLSWLLMISILPLLSDIIPISRQQHVSLPQSPSGKWSFSTCGAFIAYFQTGLKESLMKDGSFPNRWQFGPITLYTRVWHDQVWLWNVLAFTSTNGAGENSHPAFTATSVGCREYLNPWSSKQDHLPSANLVSSSASRTYEIYALLILLLWTSVWWSCSTPSDCAIAHDCLVSTLESFRISAPHSGKYLQALSFYTSFLTLEALEVIGLMILDGAW